MKLATPLLHHTIELSDERLTSLVIENGKLFRNLIQDLSDCALHGDGETILSEGGEEVKFTDSVEIISDFVPFSLNTKTLITSLMKRLEKRALSSDLRDATHAMLQSAQAYIQSLTLDIPHEIVCEDLSVSSIIKGCSPTFAQEDAELVNQILDYMRLVREFSGEKTFILVNMRSYLTDDETALLCKTCLSEHFVMLLIDGCARRLLPQEARLLVDSDLCELTPSDDSDFML